MLRRLRKLCRKLLQDALFLALWKLRYGRRYRLYLENRRSVIEYLESEGNGLDAEKSAVLDFLRRHLLSSFPYPFSLRYHPDDVAVFSRAGDGRKYVLHRGKKVFFKRSWGEAQIRAYFNSLRVEQDEASPHCYFGRPAYLPAAGDVIADLGAAEGIWALTFVEACEKAYLFEPDEEWAEALAETFAPWREKTVIVDRFVGASADAERTTALDVFFAGRRVDCIKADIEGAEEEMLRGAEAMLRGSVSKAVVCAYHRHGAERAIERRLADCAFDTHEVSGGYMIYGALTEERLEPPYLTRGLIFARKTK